MEQIANLLEKFAATVGMQTTRLWPELVRVWWIQQVVWIFAVPIAVALFVSLSIWTGRQAFSYHGEERGTVFSFFCAISGILALLVAFTYLLSLSTTLPALWYPEATYVQSLLNTATKK